MGEGEVKRDRISEMPQEIKEQIISSLCMKDAISTSSLSSVWRYSWVSLPFLDFGFDVYQQITSFFTNLPTTHPKKRHLYSIFHKAKEENDSESTVDYTDYCESTDWYAGLIRNVGYLQMIDELLQIYIQKNPSSRDLKKISLYVPMLSDPKMRDYGALVVSRCLSLAKHNVTELDYWINDFWWHRCPNDSYLALQNCLPILELKTLTKLTLRRCYLAVENKVDLPIDLLNLKDLRLIEFNNLHENMLESLLAKCRALERLEFSLCEGFKVLRIPRFLKLKKLKVKHLLDLELVEINAMSLQCLTLINLETKKCKVKMASNSCNSFVNLFVDGCGVSDDFLNVAEFPHLKIVSLSPCPQLKHIKIIFNSLTSFDVKDCHAEICSR